MLHESEEEFLKILERTSAQTGFPLRLLEKDYYITMVLSKINELSRDLIFKGGTCLSKIYYSYYRLSEDLDLTLKLSAKSTRTTRSNAIRSIKSALRDFLGTFGMNVKDLEKAGHRESTQYIFYLEYDSVVLSKNEIIKLEAGMRCNPLLPVVTKRINHKFLHPFTQEPLFDARSVHCLALKELVAEKMRAAATREIIAGKDFYDLGYLLNEGFNFRDKELLALFRRKLEEDNFSSELKRYRINLGRSNKEIEDMKERIEDELFSVLTIDKQKSFDIQKTLDGLNDALKEIE